jgi:hypothetical protein
LPAVTNTAAADEQTELAMTRPMAVEATTPSGRIVIEQLDVERRVFDEQHAN